MEHRSPTIVAIDENRDHLKVLNAFISDAFPKARVITATSGMEGIELVREHDPDLVLLDIVMPVMDRYEVCRHLKEDPQLRTIPVVFLTALNGDRENRVLALEAGGDAFITKPFDEAEFIAQVRAMVKLKAANERERDEKKYLAGLVADRTRDLKRELAERKVVEEQLREANRVLAQSRTAMLNLLEDVNIEIDARKRSEEALKTSEERFRGVTERSSDLILLMDDNGQATYVSPSCERILGYLPEEIVGRMPEEFILPEDCAIIQEGIRFNVTWNISEQIEVRFRRKDGRVALVEITAIPILSEGGVEGIQVIGRDITERRRMEDEIRTMYTRFQNAMDAGNMAWWEMDCQTGAVAFHKKKAHMLGYPPEHFTRYTDFCDLLHPDDFERVMQAMREHLAGKRTRYDVEYRIRTASGEYRWFRDIGGVSASDPSGKPLTVTGILIDISERKQMESALRDSEEKYRTIFENSGTAVVLVEENTIISVANEEFARLVGLPKEEIEGHRSWTEFVVADDLDRMREQHKMRRANHDKALKHYEFRLIGASGTIHHIFLSIDVIPGTKKSVASLLDITRHKQVEEDLRDRERFLDTLIGNLPGFVYRCANDRDWTMAYISTGCEELTGYAPKDFIGNRTLSYNDLVDPAYRQVLWEKWQELLARRGVFEEEYPITTRGGERRWVWERGRGIYAENGELLYLEGFITDISGRRRAEESLRESEARYSSLFDHNFSVSLLIDPDTGRIVDVNDAACWYYGFSREELLARTIADLNHLPLDKVIRDLVRAKSEKAKHFFSTHYLANGEQRNVEVYSGPITVQEKPLFYSIIHDVTDRKRAEEALRQTNKKLQLLSGITRHDIRNQLMALEGYLGLAHETEGDPATRDYISRSIDISRRISSVIEFTKLVDQIGVEAPVWQDAGSLVDTASKDVSSGPVRLINDIPPGVRIHVDPLIVKVFYNLMDNAVRYGNTITTLRWWSEERKEGLVMVCEDDGGGIPEDRKELIFENGFGHHTGLGLFLSREILSIAGITIIENGKPGKGARFEITFPKGIYRIEPQECPDERRRAT